MKLVPYVFLISALLLQSSCADSGKADPVVDDDDNCSSVDDDDSSAQPADIGPGTTSVLYVMVTVLDSRSQCVGSDDEYTSWAYVNYRWTIQRGYPDPEGNPAEAGPDAIPITIIAEREECSKTDCDHLPDDIGISVEFCKEHACIHKNGTLSKLVYEGWQFPNRSFYASLTDWPYDYPYELWNGLYSIKGHFIRSMDNPEVLVTASYPPRQGDYPANGNMIFGGSKGWHAPVTPVSLGGGDISEISGFGSECDAVCK